MRKFVVEVYSDNDISAETIHVWLSSRFGNMIASVKEEAAQQGVQSDGELPCLACGGEVGHRINCPRYRVFPVPRR